jgi:ABC-type multidrug transport system ATPase subunit
VLARVECTFHGGRVTGIVGPASSGKSLLLGAIVGQPPPASGAILVNGRDPASSAEAVRREVTCVPTHAPLLMHLTVLEHVRLLLMLASQHSVADRQAITALRLFELPDDLHNQRVDRLGACDRLKVWLAVHRLREAPILIVDDATSDLSAPDTADAARLLRDATQGGRTVAVAGRDRETVLGMADDLFQIEGTRLELRRTRRLDPDPAAGTLEER